MMIVFDLIEAIATVIGGVLRLLVHVAEIFISIPWGSRDDDTKRNASDPRDPPPQEAGRALIEAAERREPHTSVPTTGEKNP